MTNKNISDMSTMEVYSLASYACEVLTDIIDNASLCMEDYTWLGKGFEAELKQATRDYEEYSLIRAGIRDCMTDGDVEMLRIELKALRAIL